MTTPLARRRAGDRGGRRVHDPGPPGSGLPRAGGRLLERGRRSRRPAPRHGDRSRSRRHSAGSSRPRPSRSPRPTCWPASRSTSCRTTRSVASRSDPARSPSPASATTSAELIPAATLHRRRRLGRRGPRRGATDSLATAPPVDRPNRPVPYLSGIEFRFFDDAGRAGRLPIERATLDAASGLPPAMAAGARGRADGSRALRYPGATLTAVLLNLRPGHPEFAKPAVRTALLAAIDRRRLITDAFAMAAAPGDRAHPARVGAVRSDRRPARPLRPGRGQDGAQEGRLDAGRRRLAPARGRRRPIVHRAAEPGRGVEPGCVRGGRRPSPGTGRALGLSVTHVAAAARRVRDRAAGDAATSAPRSATSRSASTPTCIRCWPRARP